MIRQSLLRYRRWTAGFMLISLFGMAMDFINPATPAKITLETQETRRRPEPFKQANRVKTAETVENKSVTSKNAGSQEDKNLPVNSGQEQRPLAGRVDIYLLARVIHAEARGEPFEGQVAVGAVLMNRLKNPRFPKSLKQIIFKRGEFCTVRDGQIWMAPDANAMKAARLAAAGWDPTGGAHYFYNPAKTTSRWIWSRPVTHRIGRHVFAI